jgi:hypothetical protein
LTAGKTNVSREKKSQKQQMIVLLFNKFVKDNFLENNDRYGSAKICCIGINVDDYCYNDIGIVTKIIPDRHCFPVGFVIKLAFTSELNDDSGCPPEHSINVAERQRKTCFG